MNVVNDESDNFVHVAWTLTIEGDISGAFSFAFTNFAVERDVNNTYNGRSDNYLS